MTTVLDKVRGFVTRLTPTAVCDDCIAERLKLSIRQHANHKTRELAGLAGFTRTRAPCGLCGEEKLVIARS